MMDFGWQGMDVRRPMVPSWVTAVGPIAPMLTVFPDGDPLVSKSLLAPGYIAEIQRQKYTSKQTLGMIVCETALGRSPFRLELSSIILLPQQ